MELYFSFSGGFNAVLSTVLGLLIFLKNRKNKVNITFALFCLCVALWSYPYIMWPIAKTKESALFWFQVLHIGPFFASVAYLHFVSVWLDIYNKLRRVIIYVGYLLSVFFTFFVFSPYFIADMVPKFSMNFWAEPGILYHFYLLLFFGYAIYSFYLLMKHYIKCGNSARKYQIGLILLGTILAYIGGSTNYFLWYNINIPPYGNILASSYVVLTAYAIVTHSFMDIKLVLRKSTTYFISLIIILAPIIIFKYLGTHYLPEFCNIFDIILMIIAISLFPVLRKRVYRFSNKYLFTSLYDSKKVIADISEQLGTTLEAKKIYKFVAQSLMGAFHTKALAVLTFDKKGESFLISYNNGFQCDGKKIPIGHHAEIYKQFISRDKIIVFDEIRNLQAPGLKEFMDEYNKGMGVEVIVPLTIKNKNIGVLALGAKESGDIYNKEDMEVLKVINSQVAISLENASLYEETKGFNLKLTKEVEKATKELKQANEELRKLDEAKSEFISIASHQLRTPLTVIKGYVSMMLEGSFGKLEAKVDENLYKVYESNERLIHLVENLLNISRIESGRLQFNYDKVDLVDTVESVVEELEHTAKKKKVYLNYEPPKKSLPDINIDEEKIRQVIINLIDNSIKYTKKGGVTVKLELLGEKVRFTVSDTGMGISKEDLPNLFKKFSRGKDTSLVHTEGTGLGLYVGKMMIEAHKGKIWAESDGVGKGSRFIFELPIKIKNPPKKLEGQVI